MKRFGPRYTDLVSQLNACGYTRRDAANKKDATGYIQKVLKISKGLHYHEFIKFDHVKAGITTAFQRFEASLQRDLDPPTNLTSFIDQVQLRQQGWFQMYANYGTAKPNQQQQLSRNPYRPPAHQYRPPTGPATTMGPPYSGQRQLPAPQSQQPRTYWADQEEEEEDWIYDAPSDAWYVAANKTHGPGHTPRRFGNTHDGAYGAEARANWVAAGEGNRCERDGCTHYHD